MAAAPAFWTATAVVVAPDAENMTTEEAVELFGLDAELQQQKKAVPPRKRVHEADPEGRRATRRATGPHPLPMAAAAAFWAAPPAAVAPDADHTAATGAGAPVVRERAGRKATPRVTTFDGGGAIKANF